MATPGLRAVLPLIPPVLLTQLWIDTPTTVLADCRILGSTDPTYGTVGWTPRLDGKPFAILTWQQTGDDQTQETWHVHAMWAVELFIAIAHATDPIALQNFNDLALAWDDASRLVIASNRRLSPSADNLFPTQGDLRWWRTGGQPVPARVIYGTAYMGVSIATQLEAAITVDYQ